ncbi:MAG: polysaccharide pyruvyl transferase family protein, partial [Sphingobacteriaceae bacterium]
FKPAGQIENTGDLLINKSEIDALRRFGEIIIDDNNTPVWFIDAISDPQVDKKLSATSGKSLRMSILMQLLSGKNGKQIYYVIPPGHRSTKGYKSALRSLSGGIKNFILKSFGCRIIRMGFSIGPFDNLNGQIDAMMSGSYHYFGLRDQKSLALAQKLNFKNPQYFPDLAWCYAPYPATAATMRADKDYVVLSFRSNEYGTSHQEDYLVPIVSKIKALLESGAKGSKVILSYQVQYDRDACIYIQQQLAGEFETELIDHKMLLPEAEGLYRNAKFVLSNRLHVLLLAFQTNALSIPLIKPEDNKKIVGIYADNGLGSMILDSEQDIALLTSSLGEILDNSTKYQQLFRDASQSNTGIIGQKLDSIFNN